MMEHQKYEIYWMKEAILNLWDENETSNENDHLNANYDVGNEIIYNTEVWKSNLFDYNDAWILVRGDITIIGHQVTEIAFKNCTNH